MLMWKRYLLQFWCHITSNVTFSHIFFFLSTLFWSTIDPYKAGMGVNLNPHPPLWYFQNCIFQKEGEALVFVTYNII